MTLIPWKTISANYRECAILGNGASIALANKLSYSSLYNAAVDRNHLSPAHQKVFQLFNTQDFEFVLRALSYANAINGHLGIVESVTVDTYTNVRDALIRTVKEVHPDHNDVSDQFNRMADFLAPFPTVFSLNYDLLVYWAMMQANDKVGGNLFKDCFKEDGHFEFNYDFLRKPHKTLATSTLVFFPHGNLALATNMWGAETKISQVAGSLLDAITHSWTLSGLTPLFVSEGDSDRKLLSIGRNAYLNQVYSEISVPRSSVLIYGWGISKQDSHILKALGRAGVSRFAISVYTAAGDPNDYCYQVGRAIRQTQGLEKAQIEFFDAGESGVWINP